MKKHSFFSRELPFIVAPFLIGALLYLIHLSPFGQWIYKNTDLTYYFQGRSVLGYDHKVDPRLKIYIMDDLTVTSLRERDLSALRWTEVFRAISKENPKAILTPHSFSVLKTLHDPIGFTDDIRDIKSKIAIGVWLTNKKIPGLLPLAPEDYPSFSLKNYFGTSNPGLVKWHTEQERQMFGPNPGVMNAFTYFGGTWGSGTEVPLVTKLGDEHALAHLALHAADTLVADSENLLVNEIKVPMTSSGMIQVNLLDPASFFEKSRSMIEPIRRVMRSIPFDEELSNGDVVLILPNFSTGHINYTNTPLGYMPEGYVVASIVNSVLTGNWIHPQRLEWAYILLMSIVGLIIGRYFKGSRVLILTGLSALGAYTGGLFLFLSMGLAFPAFISTVSLTLVSIACLLIRRTRLSQRYEESLRVPRYLWGRNGTKEIEKRYRRLPDEPTKQIVSLVHFRIEGVERILKKLSGEPLFDEFRRYELEQSKIIHEMGGVEVKSRNGQKLAYFSPAVDGKRSENHAERAMLCAEKLFKNYADLLEDKLEEGDFVVKMSAAVDSAPIHIGNFGDLDHLVPVALGSPVENIMALSYECPEMSIFISKSTYTLLDQEEYGRIKEQKIDYQGIKIPYYHYKPLSDRKEFLSKLEKSL